MAEPGDAGLHRLWSWRITSISTPLTTTAAPCTKRAQPHAFCFCRCHGDQATRWLHPPAFHCRGHTHTQTHTLRCLSVIIFPGSQKVTVTTMNWSGTYQSHRPSSNHRRLLGRHASTRASPCCVPSRTKGRWWRRRERIRIAWRLWGETAIIWWFHFLQQSKLIRCWRRCRQVRSFLPTFTRRPWGSRLNSLKVFHPVAPPDQPCPILWLITLLYRHTCARKHRHALVKCAKTNLYMHTRI